MFFSQAFISERFTALNNLKARNELERVERKIKYRKYFPNRPISGFLSLKLNYPFYIALSDVILRS